MDLETATSLIRTSSLGSHASALAAHLRPTIRLRTERVGAGSLSLGESRMGGEPDLPVDLEWPAFQGAPLGFLAQIRLDDLPAIQATLDIPSDGWLLFFHHADQATWGFDPADKGSARVLHVPGSTTLERRALPNLGDDSFDAHACRVTLEPGYDLPELQQIDLPADLKDQDETWDAYEALETALSGSEPAHHLFGNPQPIQNEMELECQLVTNGLYCGDATGYEDARAEALAQGAQDWRLLLQVDTDEEGPGWMWGDSGRLYFWMRRQDAAARAFDRAWMVLQCC